MDSFACLLTGEHVLARMTLELDSNWFHGRIEDSTNTTGINGWTQLIDLDCLGNTLRRFSPLAIER